VPSEFRAAVIGAGQIAQQHLACLARLPQVRIAAVCDRSAAAAEWAFERHGAEAWFTDHVRMLETVRAQVVHVATPPASHFALARDCLEAGAHVFLEKPATSSLAELETLLALAEAKDRTLVEDYNYLWNEPVLELRRAVQAGELGELQHVEVTLCLDILGAGSPFADRGLRHPALALPGGAIGDFLPHLASLAYAFCGAHQEAHTTWEKRSSASTLPYDEFRALVRGARSSATLAFSAHAQPDSFRLTVYGSRGRATADIFEHRLTRALPRAVPKPLVPFFNALDDARCTSASAFRLLWRKLSAGPGAYDGLWRLIGRFYDGLGGAVPPLSRREVLEVNQMVAVLAPRAERT
jgi:predicted dehydrogenase